MSWEFPWNYLDSVTKVAAEVDSIDTSGMSHLLYYVEREEEPSQYYKYIHPLLEQIMEEAGACKILRARVDAVLSLQYFSNPEFEPHVDLSHLPNISAVFYIGDSDGDTIIYRNTLPVGGRDGDVPGNLEELVRVSPKANRLVLFKGEHWHTGCRPTNGRRVLINSNYLVNENNQVEHN